MNRSRFASLLILVPLLTAARALPQNLLKNPSFASNLSGWVTLTGPVSASWNAIDGNGSPTSGSAQLTENDAKEGVPATGLEQCVPVTGGAVYTVALRARVLAGPPSSPNTGGYVPINFYATSDCSGDVIGGVGPNTATGTGTFGSSIAAVPAPAEARSAEVLLALAPFNDAPVLTVLFEDVIFAPQDLQTLTVPASASIHGQSQTFFHSDLWIVNKSFGYPVQYQATFRCFAGFDCGTGSKTLVVSPRRSAFFTDALATLFGASETAGAIEIQYDAALGGLTASSRVYTPSLPSPTQGSGIPALAFSEARLRSIFPGLGANGGDLGSGFRSNAGAYNPNGTEAALTFTLYASDGTRIGSPVNRTAAAHEAFQINDVFAEAGAGTARTTNAYLVLTASQRVFGYVTLIDNQSGDSVFIGASDDLPLP